MGSASTLVGRLPQRASLDAAAARARRGHGSVVLLSGEAGVGKSCLAAEAARACGGLALAGAATQGGTAPYGPVVAALRAHLRAHPRDLDGCGPLRAHLALILPELGQPAGDGDRATLLEAVRAALAHLVADGHGTLVLDDLHWSDEATLELLAGVAGGLDTLPLLVIAAFRSDGLPRDHGLRRLRHELRRAGLLEELALDPLDLAETSELVARGLGGAPAPSLARAIHDRTQGNPFFAEELAAALRAKGALTAGRRGLELAGDGEVPLPDTVRDAVLIVAAELSAEGRAAADAAAVAGEAFDLEIVGRLSSDGGLAELAERGLIVEDGRGGGRFRHALTRDGLLADVPWLRRRALHRALAVELEATRAPSRELATHWLGARDDERARQALLRAAQESEAVHAYRDAAAAGRQALELWPDGADGAERGAALERFAHCAELAGELAEAARAWREVAELCDAAGRAGAVADAHRRLAAIHELRGDRQAAFAAREEAAARYTADGRHAEAAVEQLAMANHLRSAALHGAAVRLARTAGLQAERAGRQDLRIRALGLEGLAAAKGGDPEGGLETVRTGLALALEHDLTAVAAELYQRLSVVLYDAADYPRAQDALDAALALCHAIGGDAVTELACDTCMAYVLRDRGEWRRAAEVCQELISAGTGVFVAQALLGAVYGFQGRLTAARRLLSAALGTASALGQYSMRVDSTAALAYVAAAEGDDGEAAEHCRALLRHWADSDDHHYAVWGLRWAAGFSARRGDLAGAHACAEALTRVASDAGHPDALAALAHALAEIALSNRDADAAAEQLSRAVELHQGLDMPFERAQIELRAGVALSAAGEREPALERLTDAYRTARRLGARPLAAEAAREVAALGESVAGRLGPRAAADADGAGLSRRELEVVRLVAVGRTNREIADRLFLSPRTVDMHVRNILGKLGCRSRVEAAHRAGEMGLLS